jgi:hypothetical protein
MASFRTESGGDTITFHDVHVFGLPWWVMPTVLMIVAAALFAWSKRVS